MNQGFISVPFKTETAHGFTSVNGVAKFSAAGIVFEFESKFLGLLGGGVKEARLPIGEILDIKFRKRFFKRSGKIEIRTRTYATLATLPNEDGKVTLKLGRYDLERGEEAVRQIERTIEALARDLPPPQTPVSQLFLDDTEDETRELKKEADK
ncbi:MAG TPA: hypothetical protein PKD24_00385 [Pyrinomonadaceae bacterium]|nr:hypothetical protein [Pyrinomonadaceae bacterium]HMP64388.1 hypothetical protein [Pyrinomonadaceae bacterium]